MKEEMNESGDVFFSMAWCCGSKVAGWLAAGSCKSQGNCPQIPPFATISEFREAILATCKPRFPNVRLARRRPIGLAVSGGVDSMALAYLFSHYIKTYKSQHIADNPVHDVLAVTVDHRLRPESTAEAAKVAANVRHLGLRALVLRINWSDHLGPDVVPSKQPNIESMARTLRYRALGSLFLKQNVMSLFFGHHRDDQYETILMRLLSGHGYRGLQGIHKANSIPECYDMYGAYKSGLVDDQLRLRPFLKFSPAGREMRALRNRLKLESTLPGFEQFRSYLGINDLSARLPGQLQHDLDVSLPYLPPLSVEDGGITIYRPLLEFDKARLIATCEANRVPWFEDGTNVDATLTTRNALRKICRDYELPRALQKPSILALAERSRQRVHNEENEASRIIRHQRTIVDFDPNVGSLLVDLPLLKIGRAMNGRHNQTARDEARLGRQRLLAATITRKLISFVTPDKHLPPISNLENTVRRLFPFLYTDANTVELGGAGRKAFSIAGVQFEPVPSYKSTRWSISRTPFSSNYLREVTAKPETTIERPRWVSSPTPLPWEAPSDPTWKTWKSALLWDGRFWIRLNSCDRRNGLHVLPLLASHTKAFKAALTPKGRARFEKLLKYHAPGKVRYTLPGIYAVEKSSGPQEGIGQAQRKMMLLALPTLGVQIAGLEKWVRYDARYKNVDTQLLGKGNYSKTSRMHEFTARIGVSRKLRQQRMHRMHGKTPT
ncbi:PP-loop family [Cordyceps militaris]|uniref:tRNA(Ile)-lysidine synthetase n=1 Tax=Cordyceps militaris TaxID=73501 RepID=A0A2H4SI93_CORMI|nr:PP-loop family [Cordyceps militaris]